MAQVLHGIAASTGLTSAPAFLFIQPDLSFQPKKIVDVELEQDRFEKAVQAASNEIQQIKKAASQTMGEQTIKVFDAHLLILQDPEFTGAIQEIIADEHICSETALKRVEEKFITILSGMTDNAYMQGRATDVYDVSRRLLAHLLGKKLPDPALIDHEVIIVTSDLTPSDTAQFNKAYVKGIVTDLGSQTSHSAIMAQSLEIPAVVGMSNATNVIKTGTKLIVDGDKGTVTVDPSEADLSVYLQKKRDERHFRAQAAKLASEGSQTRDGHAVTIAANIGSSRDLPEAVEKGAEGIGLYRTEFLYMNQSNFPTESQQLDAYKAALTKMPNRLVIIRTLDIGGDKRLSYWDLPREQNPFLGLRAIRLSFTEQKIFRMQLRALLRASGYGQLGIMFPMIATMEELDRALKILAEEKARLQREGVKIGNYKVGMMIEVPAAAILADQFASKVDFFSIGTNDLIQYTMAADRGNQSVAYLYQPENPAVLALIKNTIEAAHNHHIPCGMCGAAAGRKTMIPYLLGLGLEVFSMNAGQILPARALIKQISLLEATALTADALQAKSGQENVERAQEFLQDLNS